MKKSGAVITVLLFAALMLAVTLTVHGIGERAGASEKATVLRSVRSAALACYAAEGAYPVDLDYLKKHYGLVYDEAVYTVRYDAFAANIFPDVYVTEGGAGR